MFMQARGVDDSTGRVYILEVVLDNGEVLHKVGMCHSARSTDRMMEILRAFFNVYRYVPQCRLRRDRKFNVPLAVEKHMHGMLDEWAFEFDKSFAGSTEFFHSIDEEVLLDYFDSFNEVDLLKCQSMDVKTYDKLMELYKEDSMEDLGVVPF